MRAALAACVISWASASMQCGHQSKSRMFTHCTGPYGPVQYVNMREFDWCPHCIEALAHEITHAARAALIDRNVYMGHQDRACETFSYVFSSLFLGFLEQLEKGNGWVPVVKNNDVKKGKKK